MLCMRSQDLQQSQIKEHEIVNIAQKTWAVRFNFDLREIQELTDTTPEELTEDDLMQCFQTSARP